MNTAVKNSYGYSDDRSAGCYIDASQDHGKIPNEGGVLFGFHVVPIRKSNIPILVIAGIHL